MGLQRQSNQLPIQLGAELGRGGEGTVFLVPALPEHVAKIYHQPPGPGKVAKLAAMARGSTPELQRAAAWPVDLLSDDSGVVQGFLMPRIGSRHDVHELYSPKSRKRRFPKADFRFVLHTAANLARAFARVHEAGHVIGDVNHGNALVGDDGTVVLIDCDSFQVRQGEQLFSCDVGSPLFTPPELTGRPFRGLVRDAAHDDFGLAILLFHLLFLGRHPFAGRAHSGDLPIERAIAESRFAYGQAGPTLDIVPPPRTLKLGAFGPQVADLFERAFAPPGGGTRPSALEWLAVLTETQRSLRPCDASSAHFHPPGDECCWCEIEALSGFRAFGSEQDRTPTSMVQQLWKRIEAVSRPSLAPPVPTLREELTPAVIEERINKHYLVRGITVAGLAAWLATTIESGFMLLVAGGAIWILGDYLGKWRIATHKVQQAGTHLQQLQNDWAIACTAHDFNSLLADLEVMKRQAQDIAREIETRDRERPLRLAALKREQYLDGRLLIREPVPGVSVSTIDMLVSNGFEGADDVLRMPRTLSTLVDNLSAERLIAWAEGCSADYQQQLQSSDSAADAELPGDRELRRDLDRLLDQLRQGPDQLAELARDVTMNRNLAEQKFVEARREYLSSRPDFVK